MRTLNSLVAFRFQLMIGAVGNRVGFYARQPELVYVPLIQLNYQNLANSHSALVNLICTLVCDFSAEAMRHSG
jgi:hypothetical protein